MTDAKDLNDKLIKGDIENYIIQGGNPCTVLEYLASSMKQDGSELWYHAASEIESCIIKIATIIGDV